METQESLHQQPDREESLLESFGTIREQLRQIPEDSFIVGAAASVALSLFLRSLRRHHDAHFVGQWAPTLLLLGLYAKRRRESRVSGQEPYSRESKGQQEVH